MPKGRIVETDSGIEGEFTVAFYDTMQRKLRDRGWIETNDIIKSGITEGLALEIGPGPGYLGLEWLKNTEGTQLKGLDISADMISIAERNAEEYGLRNRIEYVQSSGDKTPFDNTMFDAVFTNGSLHEWAEPKNTLNEIWRVLKPGGRLMVSDIVLLKQLPDSIMKSIETYITCLSGALMKDEYIGAIEAAGFQEVGIIDETVKASIEDLKIPPAEIKEVADSKILDPACGSGAFLIKTAQILFKIKTLLFSKLNMKKEDCDIKSRIVADNLYGIDIHEGGTEISKLRLWLWLISSANNKIMIEKLPHLEYNFIVGNSLIDEIDEKLKNLKIKGFDIIITNPPYGNILTPIEKKILSLKDNLTEDIYLNFLMKISRKELNFKYAGVLCPTIWNGGNQCHLLHHSHSSDFYKTGRANP